MLRQRKTHADLGWKRRGRDILGMVARILFAGIVASQIPKLERQEMRDLQRFCESWRVEVSRCRGKLYGKTNRGERSALRERLVEDFLK